MQCRQDWRSLLVPLERYIEASGDTSPISFLTEKYPIEQSVLSGAALVQLGALLGQAQQLIQQAGGGERAANAAPLAQLTTDIECAPDGSWLRVGNRTLRRIRGQQRDFVLTMVEAYRAGNFRPKREWVLRKARYAEGLYDLRHISKRPEFLEFFGQADGECWIATN